LFSIGEISAWEAKPGDVCLGVPENVYRPDFWATDSLGNERYEDVKGTETPKFRRDKKLWAAYGPCPLHIISKGGTEIIVPKGTTIVIEEVAT